MNCAKYISYKHNNILAGYTGRDTVEIGVNCSDCLYISKGSSSGCSLIMLTKLKELPSSNSEKCLKKEPTAKDPLFSVVHYVGMETHF